MDVEFLIQNISKKSPPIAELTEIIGKDWGCVQHTCN